MPDTLKLNGSVFIRPTADRLYDDLASVLMVMAHRAVDTRGAFHMALSGGSTPEPFFHRLIIDPRFRDLPWEHTHVWQVDERQVPEDDDRSNWKMIRESLIDHVPMRRRQKHAMTVLEPDGDKRYEREIMDHLPDGRLDFVLLGMGDDAHTASLFPGSPAQHERRRWVAFNEGPTVTPPTRMTLTYPALNAARELAVLIAGWGKAAALKRISEHLVARGPDPIVLPITGIAPSDGRLVWYLDAAAAGAGDRADEA
jgi:6-phosphogluconolactonase